MKDKTTKLYKAISKVLITEKEEKNISYTKLCYENDIPMSTYDDIINAKRKTSFINIAKVVKGLGLTFEEFGKKLDKELGNDFTFLDL